MSLLEVHELSKVYGEGAAATPAISELTFAVEEREFVCVIGPSGCGKTTLLRCVAGLLAPTAGSVVLRGKRVARPPDEMALVFQEYNRSLFPWMTARQNVAFPLRRKRLGKQGAARAETALDEVGLGRFVDHYPWQLSGGMQQRVAIARALAYQPSVLLMDEPFASVDAQTRADLEDLILQLRQRFGVTVVFVTHDIDEAVYLGDRIVVLTRAPGRIRETVLVGLPEPRDQIETKALAEFTRLRTHVNRVIKQEAARQPASPDAQGS
ncbi:MAG: ABC transporter, ATP-binding protein (cluster 10, nitrate/sulfonate/bicarbonate) [uncultured Solirubrobacteraceae bacterium]|uniref:ABC transporter, ATP-binding protein (Cluster 10, nitrate/sulfonate/bicarbonate) n=1 Tax=uncultured Solirubrobacteraceae bacterium TaxID=1162706 RepID=A0A6J4TSW2_9ACTN|nr:MAG: ABC transporter, ATP-binding protein (cluster 10, nitrate/sulfonate/bicarbonate) [uncultured Solirubrobacteraceae bacterium]